MSKEITITGDMKVYSYGEDRCSSIEEIRFSVPAQGNGPEAEGDIQPSPKIYTHEVKVPFVLAEMGDVEPSYEERGDGKIESYGRARITIEFLDY